MRLIFQRFTGSSRLDHRSRDGPIEIHGRLDCTRTRTTTVNKYVAGLAMRFSTSTWSDEPDGEVDSAFGDEGAA